MGNSFTVTATTAPLTTAVSYYGVQQDVANLVGNGNLIVYSNLQNDQVTPDVNRIQTGGNFADTYINNAMRGSPFAVPLTPAGAPLVEITDLWARLVAVWLYRSRGTRDDKTDSIMAAHQQYVDRMLVAYKTGAIRLEAGLRYGYAPQTPHVVM